MLIFIGIYFHWTPENSRVFKRKENINLNERQKVDILEEDIIEEKFKKL